MKKLKTIYYPILVALFAIALILGFVSNQIGYGAQADKNFVDSVKSYMEGMEFVHNSYYSTNQQKVCDNIERTLRAANIFSAGGYKDDGYEDATYNDTNGVREVSYVIQKVTLDASTLDQINKDDDELNYSFKTVTNIVVVVPGESDSNVVLFTANYDTAAKSQSGIETMEAAAMLKTVLDVAKDYENGKIPERTMIFLFTDAEHEGAVGAYAFKNQFMGFDGIASKVNVAVNFGANGTGPLAVSADKLDVSAVKGMASGLNDAIDGLFEGVSDYDVYDCAKLNVYFSGSDEYLNTARDTIKNVSPAQIATIGGAMKSLVDLYGFGEKINETTVGGTFSYMGATIAYPPVVSYVLGGIAVALLAVAVEELIRKGKKSGGLLRGLLAQFAALIITLALLYVCFFVIILILAGFGVVPINALVTIRYINEGLLLGMLLLAFAAFAGVYLVLRRINKVKATDMARGGAILAMVVGIVMSFAMPAGSLLFAIVAILEGCALIISTELADKFRGKFGADIERLFLYTIPFIVMLPAIVPMMLRAATALSAVYLPLEFAYALIGLSVIAPYFGLLKPALSTAAAKLPKHTIRVEKEVTEKVEGAKKGRVQEITHKKVYNEKVEWQYRNRYGVAILGIVATLVIVLCAVCPAYNYDTNKVDTFAYNDAVKDNAIVYVWEQTSASTTSQKLRIYDQVAYGFLGTAANGYSYNSSVGAYEKAYNGNISTLLDTETPVSVRRTDNKIEITPYGQGAWSVINIRLSYVAQVTEFTVNFDGNEYKIENDGKNVLDLEFSYVSADDYETIVIDLAFPESASLSVKMEYAQHALGERADSKKDRLPDYKDVYEMLSSNDYASQIDIGMIFILNSTYLFGKN